MRHALKLDVEVACAEITSDHRAEHLHVLDGIEPEPTRDAVPDHLDDLRHALLRRGDLDHEEVAVLARPRHLRHLASVDPMGVDDDPALGGLPEHLGQSGDRQAARADDVSQDLPRPDGRQLIHIADQEQRRMLRYGPQERIHKRHIDHAGLVDDQEVAFERVLLVAGEPTVLRVDLQQPVDGLGFEAGLLVHALGGATGRCGECHSDALRRHDAKECVEAAGLSNPRPARDDRHL